MNTETLTHIAMVIGTHCLFAGIVAAIYLASHKGDMNSCDCEE